MDRGNLLINARSQCTHCGGLGKRRRIVCHCVERKAFHKALELYLFLREYRLRLGGVMRLGLSPHGSLAYGMPYTEYVVDFELAAKRSLTSRQLRILSLHYIGGEPWSQCAPKVGVDKGEFFHEAYRTEQFLGHALIEADPPLFPSSEYFAGKRLEFGVPTRPGQAAPLMAAA
jgi:hypothetical protein